jgi:hypothetical protein
MDRTSTFATVLQRVRWDAIIKQLVQTAMNAGAHPVRINCARKRYLESAIDLTKRNPKVMMWASGLEAYVVSERISRAPLFGGLIPTVAFIMKDRSLSLEIDGQESPEEIIKAKAETRRWVTDAMNTTQQQECCICLQEEEHYNVCFRCLTHVCSKCFDRMKQTDPCPVCRQRWRW